MEIHALSFRHGALLLLFLTSWCFLFSFFSYRLSSIEINCIPIAAALSHNRPSDNELFRVYHGSPVCILHIIFRISLVCFGFFRHLVLIAWLMLYGAIFYDWMPFIGRVICCQFHIITVCLGFVSVRCGCLFERNIF